jgi:hypothetical protein
MVLLNSESVYYYRQTTCGTLAPRDTLRRHSSYDLYNGAAREASALRVNAIIDDLPDWLQLWPMLFNDYPHPADYPKWSTDRSTLRLHLARELCTLGT